MKSARGAVPVFRAGGGQTPGRTSRAGSYGKNPDTCPVRAWLTWRGAAGVTTGPAFLPITGHDRLGDHALSPEAVREIIARNAERAGLSVRLTGHSMRSGFITTSLGAGKREEKIRE